MDIGLSDLLPELGSLIPEAPPLTAIEVIIFAGVLLLMLILLLMGEH